MNNDTCFSCAICGAKIKNLSHHIVTKHCKNFSKQETIDFVINYFYTYIAPQEQDKQHTCVICGKPAMFSYRLAHVNEYGVNFGFSNVCSNSCRSSYSNALYKQRWLTEHPGEKFELPFNKPEIQEKTRQTVKKRYGENIVNISQVKSIKEKVKQTMESRYGGWYVNTKEYQESIRKTSLEKYGVEHFNQSKEKVEKCYQTKRKNHTFGYSRLEEAFAKTLTEMYGKDSFIREYNKDIRYTNPLNNHIWRCDFYIPKFDLFIEIQGTKAHGIKPFSNTVEDKEYVKKYISKKQSKSSKSFNAYQMSRFTQTDINKRTVAKNNNLNYLEIFACYPELYTKENVQKAIEYTLKHKMALWLMNNSVTKYDKDVIFEIQQVPFYSNKIDYNKSSKSKELF